MEMLQGVWKRYLRPRAVVGYGVKIFLPSPPNYVTRSPGQDEYHTLFRASILARFDFQKAILPRFQNNLISLL